LFSDAGAFAGTQAAARPRDAGAKSTPIHAAKVATLSGLTGHEAAGRSEHRRARGERDVMDPAGYEVQRHVRDEL
jgi:hypothetical protein